MILSTKKRTAQIQKTKRVSEESNQNTKKFTDIKQQCTVQMMRTFPGKRDDE